LFEVVIRTGAVAVVCPGFGRDPGCSCLDSVHNLDLTVKGLCSVLTGAQEAALRVSSFIVLSSCSSTMLKLQADRLVHLIWKQ